MTQADTRGLGLLITGGGGLREIAESAKLAEEAGFSSAWATEFYDRSATLSLAAMAAATTRITVGSAIAYAFGRTPLVWAAEARDLDELCDQRLVLGLGTGTRRMQQDWHGLDGEHPAPRMEELVPLIRRVLRLHEGPIAHDGRFYRLHCKPTASVLPPPRVDLPIYLAGVNPRMIEAAGRVGDGLVGHPLFTAEYVRDVVRPALGKGAELAGRDSAVPIAGYLTCSVDEDRDAARLAARATVAFNSTVKTYRVIHRHHGWEEHAERIRDLWMAGDFESAVHAVPDEMLDTIALAGTPDEVRARYAERWAGVYETTLLWPPAFAGAGMDAVRRVVDAFRPVLAADASC
ncbi:LLM class flavin-dependent oxidoreductase [Paraconexibacter algicola]|uniref:LLM class flavin-dependent oxidoreductase n=1 Tax=Paraconexibacter algicola TaxID=2133960 RepID=A0A2T4UK10_9ACTN|nr:LLM class flavin-dependent oxidoreductase [Paraconexibacter algicola]PTL59586.1 LLM class flavin-dependent oxidoreductase [Paraconexibacter algicola]